MPCHACPAEWTRTLSGCPRAIGMPSLSARPSVASAPGSYSLSTTEEEGATGFFQEPRRCFSTSFVLSSYSSGLCPSSPAPTRRSPGRSRTQRPPWRRRSHPQLRVCLFEGQLSWHEARGLNGCLAKIKRKHKKLTVMLWGCAPGLPAVVAAAGLSSSLSSPPPPSARTRAGLGAPRGRVLLARARRVARSKARRVSRARAGLGASRGRGAVRKSHREGRLRAPPLRPHPVPPPAEPRTTGQIHDR